jgi:hypothetical protein
MLPSLRKGETGEDEWKIGHYTASRVPPRGQMDTYWNPVTLINMWPCSFSVSSALSESAFLSCKKTHKNDKIINHWCDVSEENNDARTRGREDPYRVFHSHRELPEIRRLRIHQSPSERIVSDSQLAFDGVTNCN